MNTLLEAKKLSVSYGKKPVLKQASFWLEKGQWLMIAGPNGAGKSTLLKAVSGGISCSGEILAAGHSLRELRPGERARIMGMQSQSYSLGYDFTVEEVVRLGRYAYKGGFFGGEDPEGEEKVQEALESTGMKELVSRSVLALSGGEVQRMFLAQLFAQDPQILLLDEPTSHLDPAYQKQIFDLIEIWRRKKDRAVVSVVHDLSLARAYGSHALLLKEGSVVAFGPVERVFSETNLEKTFSMDVSAWMRSLLKQWEKESRS